MNRRYRQVLRYGLIITIVILFADIFVPRTYNVPPLKRKAGTSFWQLSTGSKIAYLFFAARGNKKSCPIIFLHGGPGGHISNRFVNIARSFTADGYDVYLYDQVGSGLSSRLDNISDYTVNRHIQDLNEIIKNTGSSKAILIGQSWGAILATLFTADHPASVEKLILTSPGPLYPINKQLVSERLPDSVILRRPFYTNAMG